MKMRTNGKSNVIKGKKPDYYTWNKTKTMQNGHLNKNVEKKNNKICYKMNLNVNHLVCSHRVLCACIYCYCGTSDKGPSNDVKIKGLIYHKVSLNIAFSVYVYITSIIHYILAVSFLLYRNRSGCVCVCVCLDCGMRMWT